MVIHVVKKGESLYGIGRSYGVNYRAIARDNELPPDAMLTVGQTVVVNTGDSVKRGMIEVNGYAFPGISNVVLEKTLPHLTYLSLFGSETTADGWLKTIDAERCVAACKAHGVLPVLVITNMDGKRGFSADIAHAIITEGGAQAAFIENTLKRLREHGFAGLDIDFENIHPDDKDSYADLLMKLADSLHNHGYFISSQLTPKTKLTGSAKGCGAHDYEAHGKAMDFITVMGYERGGGFGAPGPVSPMTELKTGLEYAAGRMDPGMILMGVPNYGYDWTLPMEEGQCARAIGNVQAPALARSVGAQIEYDKTAMAPYFNYTDASGAPHHVWFDDARSVRARLNLPFHRNIGGVSFWTVNWFSPQCWLVLDGMYDVMKG